MNITINNFSSALSRSKIGDLTSGNADFSNNSGVNPLVDQNALVFTESPRDIGGSVVTDLILGGTLWSWNPYNSGAVYAFLVGNTGRIYRVQVSDNTTDNPNYDNPVYITTLSVGSPTFTTGATVIFNKTTNYLYISHDKGLSRIGLDNFGGFTPGSEQYIGTTSGLPNAWRTDVPRVGVSFASVIYYSNGPNIATYNIGTNTITSYNTLSTDLPSGYIITDMDASSDGSFLSIIASKIPYSYNQQDFQKAQEISAFPTIIVRWDMISSTYNTINYLSDFMSFSHNNIGQNDITIGYDTTGVAIYDGTNKAITIPNMRAPVAQAATSNANMVTWITQDYVSGSVYASIYGYGKLDNGQVGLFRFLRTQPVPSQIVKSTPFMMVIGGENTYHNTINNNSRSSAKIYFSVLSSDGVNTTNKLFSLNIGNPTTASDPSSQYVTTSQSFSKKMVVKELRVYYDDYTSSSPTNVNVRIQRLSGVGKDGVVTMNNTNNSTMASWVPQMAPSYEFQVIIKAPSVLIPTIRKVELEVVEAGN